MAEVGSLSARAKMAVKIFVKCVLTFFVTNASFLCEITNLTLYTVFNLKKHFFSRKCINRDQS